MSKIKPSMVAGDGENQLELFDLANQPAARVRRESFGRFMLHMRYDQAILCSIAALLGLTIVFAFGVERGKQLLRSQQLQLAKQPQGRADAPAENKPTSAGKPPVAPKIDAAVPAKEDTPAPTPAPRQLKQKVKVAAEKGSSSKSRYAIQVVTFTRPQLAKSELDRLHASGEPAFIVIREGRTIVYVGPFPSKDNAAQKLANLRSKYEGCFIRTL